MPKDMATDMCDDIDILLAECRTLPQAVADLRAEYARNPALDLAEMIRHGEAEILDRAKTTPTQPRDSQVSRKPALAD